MKKKKLVLRILIVPAVIVIFLVVLYGTWALSNINSPNQSNSDYVGSKTCRPCHEEIHRSWSATPHANALQDVTEKHNPIIPDWRSSYSFQEGKLPQVTVKFNKTSKNVYQMTLIDANDPFVEVAYDVHRTQGGWRWKQFYSTRIDGDYYLLPVVWNTLSEKWSGFLPQLWWKKDGSLKNSHIRFLSFGSLCSGCHNTGLVLTHGLTGYKKSIYVDMNIACEKCHGPGAKHVKDSLPGSVINPRKLSFKQQVEVCGQCHTAGRSVPIGVLAPYAMKEFGGELYRVGEMLEDYFKLKPVLWDGTEYSKKHRQQFNDLMISRHYSEEVGCFECHDIHGTPYRSQLIRPVDNNELCLSCHKDDDRFADKKAIEKHTKHPYDPDNSGTSRCISCHLQKSTFNTFMGDGSSHHFQIVRPQLSLDMFREYKDEEPLPDFCNDEGSIGYNNLAYCYSNNTIPNSCNGCHTQWGKDEKGFEAGVQAYGKLFD